MLFNLLARVRPEGDEGKISNESPVGAAIIGKTVGEVVEVHVGENIINYEIVEIKH